MARHGWKLWQMKAGAWSFYLPKSQPRASHWHLQIVKTSLGVVFWAFWVTFLCFLSGCLGSLVLANASSCLKLGFARVSAQEEPLAPRSDKNKVFGHFSKRFGSLFSVLFLAGRLGSGCNLVDEKPVAHSFDLIQSQLHSSHPAPERNGEK